ncbi:MAG: SDR family oxidoreductase [Candidatus Dojkabacteria bacterium]|nr:SDR family oxidoreductase [Candidatus Dojkabacteria bacterium]
MNSNSSLSLSKKQVLITGSTSGLGRALVEIFLEYGAFVYVTGRNFIKLQEVSKDLISKGYENFVTARLDVLDVESIVSCFNTIDSLDVLVNNAGVWLEGIIEENTDYDVSKVIDTNIKGLILVTKYALPKLKKTKNNSIVVNISSTAGVEPKPRNAVYVATKYAVTGFSEALSLDLKDSNIRCICVCPGGIATNLFSTAGVHKDLTNYMSPYDIGRIIVESIIHSIRSNLVTDKIVIRRTN